MNITDTITRRFKLSELHENTGQIPDLPANPRLINKEKYDSLLASIREGDLTGVLPMKVFFYNGEWVVLGGNMRLRGMLEPGKEDVSCIIIPEGTDKETLRRIVLLDNATFGEWDWDLMANDWDIEEINAAGIDLPFLDDNDPKPTNTEAADVEEDDFDETQDQIPARCQAGDIWLLGEHKLLCGDSTKPDEIARLMGTEKADLWITDPPYNVNYEGGTEEKLTIANDHMNSGDFFQFLKSAFSVAKNVLKDGCSFYIWYASREHINFETALTAAGLEVREQLIWNKSSLVLGRFDYHYKHEPCLYGWKGGAAHNWYNDRSQTTVMDFEKPRKNDLHPTMKPVPLFAYQIANSSKKGDVVLDTFGGSGTTIIACENLGRKGRCVELDPHYCDVILARWEKLTNKQAVKA